MYDAKGVGLAATQINVHRTRGRDRHHGERNHPLVLINPEIIWTSDEMIGLGRGLPVGAHHL